MTDSRPLAAEQPVDGHAQRLALDVPEGHVDRPHGTDQGPAPAGHLRAGVEPLPDRLGLHRIGAQEHLLQAQAHAVRAAGADTLPRDPRIRVRLADPDDSFVGMHLDDQVVLRRGARPGIVIRDQQDVQVDPGDLHGRPETGDS